MTTDKDLYDETNCADSCETVDACLTLIDRMVKDIQQLRLECISTRYLLSEKLSEEEGQLLREDILSNLGTDYGDDPAYQLYRDVMYSGGDPLAFREYLRKVRNASHGEYPCWH